MRPKLFLQSGQKLVDRLSFGCEQFKQHQSGCNAVAFGNMAGKTDAAALFRPEQHAAFEHLGANILEADAGLDQRQPVRHAHFIHHRSRCQRLDNTSPALAVYNQMMQQQADDLVRGQIIAVAVHAAHPVGVTIGHQANVMRMFFEKRLAARIILFNRFGIDAAKQRVMIAVQGGDPAGGAGEQLLKTTRADAEQCVVSESEL